MLAKLWDLKLVRFTCIGVVNTVIDLTVLNTLVIVAHFPAIGANLISASISISISYFLNHKVVFRSSEPHSLTHFAHFFAVTGFGILAIQSLCIDLITHFLAHHTIGIVHIISAIHLTRISVKVFELNIAKLLAVVVTMCWNFTLYRLVIFKASDNKADKADFELPL